MVTDLAELSFTDFAIFFWHAQVCSHKHPPISEPSETRQLQKLTGSLKVPI